MYDGLRTEQFVAVLLGALVEHQGGIVKIDKHAFENFRKEKFYAVKLDFEGDEIILEVVSEDPTATPTGEDSNQS